MQATIYLKILGHAQEPCPGSLEALGFEHKTFCFATQSLNHFAKHNWLDVVFWYKLIQW